jgi:hypothetical protein
LMSHYYRPSLWSSWALCNAMAFDVTLLSAIVVKPMGALQRHGLRPCIIDFCSCMDFCSQTSIRFHSVHWHF